jgi:arginine-tRNA-protein transferase
LTEQIGTKFPQFYLTMPAPCPYLSSRLERKVFTHLQGALATPLNNALTHAGFRRSQNIAYKPACESCNACISARIVVERFVLTRSFKRVISINRDVTSRVVPTTATEEQYAILRGYLDSRHPDGGMSDMTVLDYVSMVEETAVKTQLVEYRVSADSTSSYPGNSNELIGIAITDKLADGLSMIYSFFLPSVERRSMGTYMVLDHIHQAQQRDESYVYLGYWVASCSKMDYKARFKPLEVLSPSGWIPLEINSAQQQVSDI